MKEGLAGNVQITMNIGLNPSAVSSQMFGVLAFSELYKDSCEGVDAPNTASFTHDLYFRAK